MVVMLKHCCCGCTLKTGTLIIAVVFAILSGLHIMMFSLAASQAADAAYYVRLSMEMGEQEDLEHASSASPITEQTPHNTTSEDQASNQQAISAETHVTLLTVWMWMSIFIVLMEFGILLISIFLMFAANKDNARMVYAWVLLFAVLSSSLQILQLVLVGLIFYAGSAVAAVVVLIFTLAKTAGAAYSTLVGYSYHRQLVGTAVARRISRQDD